MEADQKKGLLEEAASYNAALAGMQVKLTDPFKAGDTALFPDYSAALRFNDAGIMGYVDIPGIGVYLPIYHGTAAETLLAGVGHLEGSSLPVGGENTHTVLTGHTGLNRSKMFTDLINMEEGDLFFLHVLGETLAYEVCGIHVVLPEEQEKLQIRRGEDLCTLVTCTPYGVNDHRLLVTGRRTEYTEETMPKAKEEKTENRDSQWLSSYKKALLAGAAISAGALFLILVFPALRRKKERGEPDGES